MHLDERAEPGERRLGPLVVVGAVLEQAVAAAARGGIAEHEADDVVAEEPVEGVPGAVGPGRVGRGVERLEAGGDRGVGLERLLVEGGGRAALAQEAAVAHRGEPARRRPLHFREPLEQREPRLERLSVARPAAARDERLAEAGVVVGYDLLGPGPVGRGGGPLLVDEPRGEPGPHAGGVAAAIEPAEAILDADDAERPSARARGAVERLERRGEEPHRPGLEARASAAADAGAERRHGPPEAVVGAVVVEPAAVEREKIAKPAGGRHEGVAEERGVDGGDAGRGR